MTIEKRELPVNTQIVVKAVRDISYSIISPSRGAFDKDDSTVAKLIAGRPVILVIDSSVYRFYSELIVDYFLGNNIEVCDLVTIDGKESSKDWDIIKKICDDAISCEFPRQGVIVGVGGGVVLDVAGFVASIYRRGVPYLRIPTTLLGLVDAGIGIKHSINQRGKKNIVGSFYPPIGVVNDSRFLATLPTEEIRAGLAEITKVALAVDPELFYLIETYSKELIASNFQSPRFISDRVLYRAESAMAEELQKNLYESDLRRSMDLGHTFSPTIEAMSGFSIRHGYAVAIDILLSSVISMNRGHFPVSDLDRLFAIYMSCELPFYQNVASPENLLTGVEAIRQHRGGKLNLVIPVNIGIIDFIQDVSIEEISGAMDHCRKLVCGG